MFSLFSELANLCTKFLKHGIQIHNFLSSDDGSYWSHEAAVPRGHAPLVLTSVPGLQQPARSQQLERHHQIQLRRQIDHLSKVVAEKEYQVEQNRFVWCAVCPLV